MADVPTPMTPEYLVALGKTIRLRRQKKDMTIVDLAEAIGVSQPAITYIETGQNLPSMETLHKIAEALKWTAWQLLREAENQLNSPA